MAHGFGKRQRIEIGAQPMQGLHRQRVVAQQLPQRLHEAIRVQARQRFQHLQHRLAGLARELARLQDHLDIQRDGHRFRYQIHCRLPARSKIGMYISVTTTPITSPITTISTGSSSRVNHSTARAISSS